MAFGFRGSTETGQFFLPGQRVAKGTYMDTESGRRVEITEDDYLPATLNGRVACYVRVARLWGELNPVGKEPVTDGSRLDEMEHVYSRRIPHEKI